MNSVALPASASPSAASPAFGAEADLVRQAGRGDAESFHELYRRHSAPVWRLAQAVTPDADAAVSAFKDGFVRAIRGGRTARRAGAAFRPHALSAVYRAAIDQSASGTAAPPRAHRSVAADADAALADAAFRSLPERWRAAVWLRDVENIDADRIAIVLAVSATVAEQLVSRGRRGLAGRFAQAHRELPEHIGEVLRPLTLAIPANLSDVTAARWSSVGSDHLPLFAPISGWLEERGVRPMSVAVGALVGLGLIGLGVVPGGSSVRSQLGAAGAGNVGAVPVQTCFGLACPAGTQGSGSLAGNAVSLGLGSLSAGGTAASGSGATGSTLGGSTGSLGTGTGSSGGSGGGSGAPGGTSPSTPTPTIPGPPIVPANPTLPSAPTTLPPVVPAGTSTVTIPGVGSVSITGGSTLPTLGVTVGGTTVTTPSIGSSSTPTTTIPTISSAVQNTTSGVTNILGGL